MPTPSIGSDQTMQKGVMNFGVMTAKAYNHDKIAGKFAENPLLKRQKFFHLGRSCRAGILSPGEP